MNRTLLFGARTLRALTGATLLAGCADLTEPTDPSRVDSSLQPSVHANPASQPFTVYTQNVYLGGDAGPILTLDLRDIPAVLRATGVFWAQVRSSDIPARAAEIVDQIERGRPHVVGLQEAFRFIVVDPRDGTVYAYVDLLDALRAEMVARGLPYEVMVVQENTSAALPLEIDFSAGAITRALAFTDRLVALRRTDVPVHDVAKGTYDTRIDLGPLAVTRGWARLSGEHDGMPFHFVTTHLEIQAVPQVQAGQLAELMGSVLDGLDGVTILAGDLNSDAEAAPGAPSWTPTYGTLVDAGFVDAWLQARRHPPDPGYTCCQNPDLRNGPSLLDERIDFVMARMAGNPSASGRIPGAMWVEVVGDEAGDRTASGLWAADHAGLVAGMRLATGLVASGR